MSMIGLNSLVDRADHKFIMIGRCIAFEDDSLSNCCNKCTAPFTTFYRRHHCRYCGKIFCGACSSKVACVPDDNSNLYECLTTPFPERVCDECFSSIANLEKNKKTIKTFLTMKLTIKDVKRLGSLIRGWGYSAYFYLGKFVNIQNKQSFELYSKLEKKLLRNNHQYLVGHGTFVYHLFKSCDNDDEVKKYFHLLNSKKTVNCKSIMCVGNNCVPEISWMDGMSLIKKYKDSCDINVIMPTLLVVGIICIKDINDDILEACLPFLVSCIPYDFNHSLMEYFLVDRMNENQNISNKVFWLLNYYSFSIDTSKLKNSITGTEFTERLNEIYERVINSTSKTVSNGMKMTLSFEPIILSPLDNTTKISKIYVDDVDITKSATRSMILPCLTDANQKVTIMHKKEDVLQDLLVQNIIKLCRIELQKTEDPHIVTYEVLPIDKNAGLIEFVKNSVTLSSISTKKSCILRNELTNADINTAKNIIPSLAAYSVITYLLSVGDRHLGNIMINDKNEIFHIDYGFILGSESFAEHILKSPIFGYADIKITYDMVSALGGLDSPDKKEFVKKSCEYFIKLRKLSSITITLMSVLAPSKFLEKDIIASVSKRFMLGNTDAEAYHIFEKIINNNIEKAISLGSTSRDYYSSQTDMGAVAEKLSAVTYDAIGIVNEATTSVASKLLSYVWWK